MLLIPMLLLLLIVHHLCLTLKLKRGTHMTIKKIQLVITKPVFNKFARQTTQGI